MISNGEIAKKKATKSKQILSETEIENGLNQNRSININIYRVFGSLVEKKNQLLAWQPQVQ